MSRARALRAGRRRFHRRLFPPPAPFSPALRAGPRAAGLEPSAGPHEAGPSPKKDVHFIFKRPKFRAPEAALVFIGKRKKRLIHLESLQASYYGAIV